MDTLIEMELAEMPLTQHAAGAATAPTFSTVVAGLTLTPGTWLYYVVGAYCGGSPAAIENNGLIVTMGAGGATLREQIPVTPTDPGCIASCVRVSVNTLLEVRGNGSLTAGVGAAAAITVVRIAD